MDPPSTHTHTNTHPLYWSHAHLYICHSYFLSSHTFTPLPVTLSYILSFLLSHMLSFLLSHIHPFFPPLTHTSFLFSSHTSSISFSSSFLWLCKELHTEAFEKNKKFLFRIMARTSKVMSPPTPLSLYMFPLPQPFTLALYAITLTSSLYA